MTPPAEAAGRFLWALLTGAMLGVVYDFLRPLRPRRIWLSDGLFLAATGRALLVLAFDICRGDLRMGYLWGAIAGWMLWQWSLGRLARPLFSRFWKIIAGIGEFFLWPLQKISKNVKNLFASRKKSGTIK